MRLLRFLKPFLPITILAALVAAGYFTRDRWLPLLERSKPNAAIESNDEATTAVSKVLVSEPAQENLGLVAKPLRPQTFWKTIQVPGMVVDRPGQSDRGIVAPATGIVAKIIRFPGDTVQPGDELFRIKLSSESLYLTQTELFKTTQEIAIAQAMKKRLVGAGGVIPEAKIIEADNQITRLQVSVKAYRQELNNRGLGSEQIDAIAEGKFVGELPIVVPPRSSEPTPKGSSLGALPPDIASASTFEIQELKVDLGQQVQAGQTLCLLSNHQWLAVEGRAFRDETPLLEKSVKEGWPVEVDFQEDVATDWPALDQGFRIRHLANTIDPVNRTFAFLMPLVNQSRTVEDEGRTQTLWRFRPGQKVRILVRVAKLDNVFVLPTDAVARDGAEAFVFTQNVNTFERKPVRVLLQDRQQVVLANDGSLVPGSYVVQGSATQLNRLLKAGSSGVPKGYHLHADGSLHKNGEEEP